MSKHTPGPWHVENKRGIANNLLRICSGLSGVARVNSNVHEEANARLIAAAPDMRKACDAMLEWWAEHQYDTVLGGDGIEINVYDSELEMVTLARAAIAKAEGGQDE